jgi:hypothetical protein
MKELKAIRNKILFLRNMEVISKQAETELLNTLNSTEAVIKYNRCSTLLQAENKALSFEDWTNLNNYRFQRTTYFDKKGTIFFDKELKQMYNQYLSSL